MVRRGNPKKENLWLEGDEFSDFVAALAKFAKRIAKEAATEAIAESDKAKGGDADKQKQDAPAK